MSPTQKAAATKAAIDTITRLIDNGPAFGEIGVTLTIHAGEVRHVSETCKRTTNWGHKE